MQISLIKENVLYTCILPDKRKGQYWVAQMNDEGQEERVVGIEGMEGQWILKSNKHAVLLDEQDRKIKDLAIEPLRFYPLQLKKTDERAWLYSEPLSNDRKYFKKLRLPEEGQIAIGRSKQNDICFANPYTSSEQAEMTVSGGQVSIRDLNSSNGTFVNGRRIEKKLLEPGDTIYILGLKIIVGNRYIAINNPDGEMTYNEALLRPFVKQASDPAEEAGGDDVHEDDSAVGLFYRSPRFKRDIAGKHFKIDSPPALGNQEQTPMMLVLGPSITMGIAALFMGVFTLQNSLRSSGSLSTALPSLVMAASLIVGAVLWPILSRRHETRKREEREKLRQEKYKQYLEEVRQAIADECAHQSEILHENHVTIDHCVARIRQRKRNLWERMYGQNDFLKLRLGLGSLPLEASIEFPERKFSMDDDNLQDELYQLGEEPKMLEKVPITLSLTEDWITGVIGSRNSVIDLVKGLILQLVALHSYDELKLVFIYDPREHGVWEFAKWLPHVWHEEAGIRFIASNPNEVKELSSFLEKEVARREAISSDDELGDVRPHYVILAMDKNLAAKAEMIRAIYKHKKNYGFSVVHLYDELMKLPKDCSLVVETGRNLSKIFDRDDISGKHIAFQPDFYLMHDERELAVSLANLKLDSSDANYVLPNMLTFLEMLDVGKIEHLNALTRWKDNDPTLSLEAPIGVDTGGEWFKLDLHEKFHGPHGLIAGMTGSGKSELIMTYILSLAVNYHPHEVAFILIDYKGGGMAHTFTRLPHLAGTITNLDGAAVNRSLISIQSELKRRQAIFSETSKKVNISNIDIYKYQKLYREGLVQEPLQHLFIISDEFAELKTQQPEFMAQLISAARIGRSLGIHLILATQKPSGVVDDQIWSNSKFRICLKVQEKADSMDMIKRPDAAELSATGRYYVQVGFNELFELGQSAWAGAPYYPSDRIEKHADDSIAVIDNLGRVIKQVSLDKKKQANPNPAKQIDEVVGYLSAIAKEENIKVKPLWLEPIAEWIVVDELQDKYRVPPARKFMMNPVIGEVDDPANQRQLVMRFPLTQEGNAVIYGAAGSGKTTFVTTLLYSLIKDHTPKELNLYILDFGSETLRAFAKAPHTGDVLLSYESEKINNLFKLLHQEIETRKKRFADYGGDYHSYLRSAEEELESIVVVIHNYSAFVEICGDKEEAVAYLTREGLKYGIYFVLTALNTGAVRYRILQNFKLLYVLQLNDENDYSSVLGKVDGVYPSKSKGRGIFKSDRVYEFQTAHICREADRTLEYLREFCEGLAQSWTHPAAKRIPILPDTIDVEFLREELKRPEASIPIGVEKNSLQVADYPFHTQYINLVLSQSLDRPDFVQGLAEAIAAKGQSELIVLDPEGRFAGEGSRPYSCVARESELEGAVVRLFNTLVYRNNTYKDAKEQGEELPVFPHLTCMICSLSGLRSRISEDARDKLNAVFDKGETLYNVHFILCETSSGVASFSYEGWFKSRVSPNDGIWVGNGISDQYQLKVTKLTSDMYQEIGDRFGYRVARGKATLVKLMTSAAVGREAEWVG